MKLITVNQEQSIGEFLIEAVRRSTKYQPKEEKECEEVKNGMNLIFDSYISGDSPEQLAKKLDEFFED